MNKYGLEARDNWIAARVEQLMDDAEWLLTTSDDWSDNAIDYATLQAEREHAAIMADLEDERINQHRGHHEF